MRPHPKAKGNPYQRKLMICRVEQGWSVAEASAAAGWSERTGYKWLQRWRAEGEAGLPDLEPEKHGFARKVALLQRAAAPPDPGHGCSQDENPEGSMNRTHIQRHS